MLIDSYPEWREPERTVHSYNRLLKVERAWGLSEEAVIHYLKRRGIPHQQLKFEEILPTLQARHPILCCFQDESVEGHYALIVGFEGHGDDEIYLFFNDPWPEYGRHFRRSLPQFFKQSKAFNHWLLRLEGSHEA